jgi:hypothetical protein
MFEGWPGSPLFLCNGGQHYVPYRWLLISNKLFDSTLCICSGVGGGEEQVHNVDYDPVKTVGGGGGEQVHNVGYAPDQPGRVVTRAIYLNPLQSVSETVASGIEPRSSCTAGDHSMQRAIQTGY